MEKHTSHYLLIEIQAQMTTVQKMNLTVSAITGIRKLGMSRAEALSVVNIKIEAKWDGQPCPICRVRYTE